MLTYLRAPLKSFMIQTKPQKVFSSDLSIENTTCFNFGLDSINITMVVYSDIYPDTLRLNNQNRDVTVLSCDLEPDIIITMPQNIFYLNQSGS